MKLEFEVMSALCEMKTFIINGVNAEYEDFGEKYDHNREEAEDYGCGDMRFTRNEPTTEILKKYSINEKEYGAICEKLEEGLSFGGCGWCV